MGSEYSDSHLSYSADVTDPALPMVTTYTYDAAGQLTTTDYSDSTPDVTVTHNRLGQPLTVTQSNQSQIANTYDPATLAIDTETISYDLDHDGTYDFSRVLDRSQDTLGRPTGYELKGSVGVPPASFTDAQATYGYSSTTGRLETVSNGTASFRYDYLANSNLISQVTATAGAVHTVTNTYEPNRNVLASKQNKVGTTVVSQYDYTVNAIGQRTNLATSGSAFANAPSWLWGYDSLGQIISADSNVNTSDRAYQYDTIGNRLQSGAGVSPAAITTYTANALNQYSQISNSQISNPSYDDDGNATAYPLPAAPSSNSALVWDGENRLVSTTVNGTTTTYLYDAQSRRICTQSPISNPQSTLYIYDGFNCIAEYSGTTLSKTRLWGIDLSGLLQGVGGVGGLLAEKQGSNIYYPLFDGNGNVSEYIDSDDAIVSHFEYDPFGNTVVNTDSGNLFNYRFSTKPLDCATGLYYYQYRYYDPLTGRWPSRDPIGEKGGINLYGFVNNDGVDKLDVNGQYVVWSPQWVDEGAVIKNGHLWVAAWLDPMLTYNHNDNTKKDNSGYVNMTHKVKVIKLQRCDGTDLSSSYTGSDGDVVFTSGYAPDYTDPFVRLVGIHPIYTVFVNTDVGGNLDNVFKALQQNLWVNLGSGKSPSV